VTWAVLGVCLGVTALCAAFNPPSLIRIISLDENTNSLMSAFVIVSEAFRQIFLIYGDIVPIMCSLTLWAPSLQFSKLVRDKSDRLSDWNKGEYSNLKIYKELKKLSNLVNVAFEGITFSYILDALLYNATNLMDAMSGHWYEQVMRIYSIWHVGLLLYFAADSCRQVSLKGFYSKFETFMNNWYF